MVTLNEYQGTKEMKPGIYLIYLAHVLFEIHICMICTSITLFGCNLYIKYGNRFPSNE